MPTRGEIFTRVERAVRAELGPATPLCDCGATFDTWDIRCRFVEAEGEADCPGFKRIEAAYRTAEAALPATERRAI